MTKQSTNNRHHIFFIEQFFWPEGWPGSKIPQEIVRELSKKHNISVLCGDKPYVRPTKKCIFTTSPHIKIINLKLPYSTHKSYKRLFNQLSFSIQLFFYICTKRPSMLVAQTNPAIALVVLAICSKLFSLPSIIICMDLYPDVLITSIKSRLVASIANGILRPIYRKIYTTCTAMVCIDRSMGEALSKYGVDKRKIHLIYNWSTIPNSINKDWQSKTGSPLEFNAKVKLLYSGNIGSSHEMQSILSLLSRFNPNECVLNVITSSSSQKHLKESSNDLIQSKKLQLCSYQEDSVYASILSSYSLGIVSLKESSLGQVSPSKFQTYLSFSLPVLYIGPPSDISNLITQYKAGYFVRNGNIDSLYNAILEYMSLPIHKKIEMKGNARHLYESLMHPSVSLFKYTQLVSSCFL